MQDQPHRRAHVRLFKLEPLGGAGDGEPERRAQARQGEEPAHSAQAGVPGRATGGTGMGPKASLAGTRLSSDPRASSQVTALPV